jgi:hypothetical protein
MEGMLTINNGVISSGQAMLVTLIEADNDRFGHQHELASHWKQCFKIISFMSTYLLPNRDIGVN